MIELILKDSGDILRKDTDKQIDVSGIKFRKDNLWVPEDDTVQTYCKLILDNDNKDEKLSNIPEGVDAYYFVDGRRLFHVDKSPNLTYLYEVNIMYAKIKQRPGGVET